MTARRLIASVAAGVCVVSGSVLSGCAAESRRASEGGSGPVGKTVAGPATSAGTGAGSTTSNAAGDATTRPATGESAKTRVSVASVDLKPEGNCHVLTVKAVLPSAGWKVEIRPLAVTTPTEREFEVVGLAPRTPSSSKAVDEQVIRTEIDLDDKVEQVVIYDVDDATVLSPR